MYTSTHSTAPNKHLQGHGRHLDEGQEHSSEGFYIHQSPLEEVSSSPIKVKTVKWKSLPTCFSLAPWIFVTLLLPHPASYTLKSHQPKLASGWLHQGKGWGATLHPSLHAQLHRLLRAINVESQSHSAHGPRSNKHMGMRQPSYQCTDLLSALLCLPPRTKAIIP